MDENTPTSTSIRGKRRNHVVASTRWIHNSTYIYLHTRGRMQLNIRFGIGATWYTNAFEYRRTAWRGGGTEGGGAKLRAPHCHKVWSDWLLFCLSALSIALFQNPQNQTLSSSWPRPQFATCWSRRRRRRRRRRWCLLNVVVGWSAVVVGAEEDPKERKRGAAGFEEESEEKWREEGGDTWGWRGSRLLGFALLTCRQGPNLGKQQLWWWGRDNGTWVRSRTRRFCTAPSWTRLVPRRNFKWCSFRVPPGFAPLRRIHIVLLAHVALFRRSLASACDLSYCSNAISSSCFCEGSVVVLPPLFFLSNFFFPLGAVGCELTGITA